MASSPLPSTTATSHEAEQLTTEMPVPLSEELDTSDVATASDKVYHAAFDPPNSKNHLKPDTEPESGMLEKPELGMSRSRSSERIELISRS